MVITSPRARIFLRSLPIEEQRVLHRMDRHNLNLGVAVDTSPMNAAVLAPGRRPYLVGKPKATFDMHHSHFSDWSLARIPLESHRKTAWSALDGRECQPCDGCQE